MTGKGRVINHNTSGRVLDYLRQHSNTDIPQIEIKRELDLAASTVSNAVVHLRSKGINITRPARGIYRLNTGPAPEPEREIPTQKLYEYVGQSGGVTIVKGEDDELYVVVSLVEYVTRGEL